MSRPISRVLHTFTRSERPRLEPEVESAKLAQLLAVASNRRSALPTHLTSQPSLSNQRENRI